jgi:hypothetical protein
MATTRVLLTLSVVFAVSWACTPAEPANESELESWGDVRSSWGDSENYGGDSEEAQEAWGYYQQWGPSNGNNNHNGNGNGNVNNNEGPYTCHAVDIINYAPGPSNTGGQIGANATNSNKVMGTPQNVDSPNFASLGFGGELVVEFHDPILNQAGDDLEVVETSYNSPTCQQNPEWAEVYASQDNTTWTSLGTICQDGWVDLGSLQWAKYIKLIDRSDPSDFNGSENGFDVDGFNATCGSTCPSWVNNLSLNVSIQYSGYNGTLSNGWPIYYIGDTMYADITICNPSSDTVDHLKVTTMEEALGSGTPLNCSNPVQQWTNVTIAPNDCLTLSYSFLLAQGCPYGNYQTHVIIVREAADGCPDAFQVFNDAQVGIYDPPAED